ncbi:MAG: hypothetical protein OEQ39_04265 [Gammaproteobacteria bacterium]|nr:hypothetical protein [Gammaproteobacteria bacterium]MDH3465584.1 hypothetical protein [Gammaproteobacteria bacterium]
MRFGFETPLSFQSEPVPQGRQIAGWATLVQALNLRAPVRQPSCISEKHVRGSQRQEGRWRVFDKRYYPGDQFADHLTFALWHEDIDLLILRLVLAAVPKPVLENYVRSAPTGAMTRRA